MTIQETTDQEELLTEIARQERNVAAKEAVVNDLKEQMKEAKEDYEDAVFKLRRLCRQEANDADRPLLNGNNGNGDGIESVTLSSPGRDSVTLTGKEFGTVAKAAKKLRGKKK